MKRHAPTTSTSDVDVACFLMSVGLKLLRVEAGTTRATFVLADPDQQGNTLRARYIRDPILKPMFRARRQLVRGVKLARASRSQCLTGSELARHWDATDEQRRAGGRV